MKFDSKQLIKQTTEMDAAIAAMRAEYQSKIQVAFHGAIKDFFDATPEVRALEWTQYTPYWQDGEECTFGVGDVWYYLSFQDPDEDEWDGGEGAGFGYGDKNPDENELVANIKDLRALINNPIKPTSEEIKKHPDRYNIAEGRYTNSNEKDRWGSYIREYSEIYNDSKAKKYLATLELELQVVRDNAAVYARKSDIIKNVEAIRQFVCKIGDEVMKDMFGDHIRVRITSEEVLTYDYDHD